MRKTDINPEQVIKKLAEVASDIAAQAGVGSLETAGQLISTLAANPEYILPLLTDCDDDFSIIDTGLLLPENGCLSWHKVDGTVITASEYRANKNTTDH